MQCRVVLGGTQSKSFWSADFFLTFFFFFRDEPRIYTCIGLISNILSTNRRPFQLLNYNNTFLLNMCSSYFSPLKSNEQNR